MPRDEIVAYLERYAAHFDCPVRTGAEVIAVRNANGSGFDIDLGDETLRAGNLIVSTGAYQKPFGPPGIDTLPDHLLTMDVSGFTNAGALPDGKVLIIGSGQTGCQIAEELVEEGREVVLACGRAPWAPRRIGDKDVMWWLLESGFLDVDATTLPVDARLFANIQASGHNGGHDLHYRTLKDLGVTLVGRFLGADNGYARSATDLYESVSWGDERYLQLRDFFQDFAVRQGLPEPSMPAPEPFTPESPTAFDLEDFGAVLYTTGFRPDYASWLPWPDAFDESGFPIQKEGESQVVESLYFVGLHFMRKRKSALLCGVGEDAGIVAEAVGRH
jgi:putative flavoprotein involved in K+ transport